MPATVTPSPRQTRRDKTGYAGDMPALMDCGAEMAGLLRTLRYHAVPFYPELVSWSKSPNFPHTCTMS